MFSFLSFELIRGTIQKNIYLLFKNIRLIVCANIPCSEMKCLPTAYRNLMSWAGQYKQNIGLKLLIIYLFFFLNQQPFCKTSSKIISRKNEFEWLFLTFSFPSFQDKSRLFLLFFLSLIRKNSFSGRKIHHHRRLF